MCYHTFAPTRTLLHAYNHDGDDDDDDHHHHRHRHRHHHIITSSHSNSPTPLNNMLIGVITSTSTIPPLGIKFRPLYEQYVDWGNNININYTPIRDQISPPL